MNVVLVEPEIPWNTGNIGRSCVATGSTLHLVGKLGFETDEASIRRSGLDYWQYLDLKRHENLEKWLAQAPEPSKLFFLSTKGERSFWEADFVSDSHLVFGGESKGLSESLRRRFASQVFHVPIVSEKVRSLNLSSCVSVVLFEALRQTSGLNLSHRNLA